MPNEVILKMRNVSIEGYTYSPTIHPRVALEGEIIERLDIMPAPGIKKVIFNNPATIILWNDGTKTVSKCHNEKFDKEKGFAMAVAKKTVGSYAKIKKLIDQAVKQDTFPFATKKEAEIFFHDKPQLEKSKKIMHMKINPYGVSFSDDGGKTWDTNRKENPYEI